jgi:hypothetical protein
VIPICLILDTVNGFAFHPYLPLATTSSGHRRFGMEDEIEEELSLAGACYIYLLFSKIWLCCLNGERYTFFPLSARLGDENCCSVWKFSSLQEA